MLSAIITIYVTGLVLFIPMFLLYTTRWTVDPSTNTTIAVLSHRPDYPLHPSIPKRIAGSVTAVLKPTAVFIVLISSGLVVVKLGVAKRTRRQMSNSQSQKSAGQSEAKITKMLLSVCFLFIIFMLPETTGTLVNFLVPEFDIKGCYQSTFELFFRFVSLASCLNSSVNFIAYVSLSAKFRATLRHIIRCSAVHCAAEDNSTSDTSVSRLTLTDT